MGHLRAEAADDEAENPAVTASVEALLADHARQGELTWDDFDRCVERRRLSREDAIAVWESIADLVGNSLGIAIQVDKATGKEADRAGFELPSHRLLSAAEEKTLGRRIRLAADLEPPSGSETADAERLERVRRGVDARKVMIEGNVRLVYSIARRYKGASLSIDDLVQEGIVGLMRAVDLWDHSRGLKFSTYATWWIRQAITRSIADDDRLIRFPVHFVEELNRFRRLRQQMRQRFEREPSDAELAAALSIPVERVLFLKHPIEAVSLDVDAEPGVRPSLHDIVPDDESLLGFEEVEDRLVMRAIQEMLHQVLSNTEFAVLALRTGLDGSEPLTLQAIGDRFNVSRERIRQIEAKARRKAASSPSILLLLGRPLPPVTPLAASKKRKGKLPARPWELASQ